MNEKMWSLDEGVKFIRWLEPKLAEIGFHCALTGGVIFNGESAKDLDVVIYQHTSKGKFQGQEELWAKLNEWTKSESSNTCGGTSQIRDEKEVRWIQARGKRVDFFFMV